MKNKTIQIRKCRRVTIFEKTEVVNLNPDSFRNLSENPYTGENDEDFLNYIKDFDIYSAPFDLDMDQLEELLKLGDEIEWEMYFSSLEKGEDSWFESGKESKNSPKTGGFEVEFSTD